MRITDIIRGILDQVDQAVEQKHQQEIPQEPVIAVVPAEAPTETQPGVDLLAIIQQLAGLPTEPDYANEPQETVAPVGAAFPGGDDVHTPKNPADIRTNAPSMYPDYQAERR
jgi:hypothetical protein